MHSRRAALPFVVIAIAGFGGCGQPGPSVPEMPARATSPDPAHGGGVDPANATYAGIYDEPLTLRDGSYEGEAFVEGGASRPRVVLADWLQVHADLDGDGRDEAVVFLEENSGGTGRFGYVAVVSNAPGAGPDSPTALIGDRVQIRGASVAGGRISVRVVQAGPGDAACCPSQLAVRHWRYTTGGLVEEDAEIEGALSLEALEGREWVLLGFGEPGEIPGEQPVTLLFDGDRVAGFSGCNRYMGSVKQERGPGGIEFGPLAGTMMACPQEQMDLERRYLATLQDAGSFGFRAGRLAMLSTDDDGELTVLLFERGPPAGSPR